MSTATRNHANPSSLHALARLVVTFGLSLAVFTPPVFASDTAQAPDPSGPLIQHSKSIIEQALDQGDSAWAKPEITERQREWARQIAEMTDIKLNGDGPGVKEARAMFPGVDKVFQRGDRKNNQASIVSNRDAVRVFLTLGKGEEGQRRFVDQLRALAGMKNVTVLLRGLPAGTRRIDELIRRLAMITKTVPGAPPVSLDPERFRKAHIEAAPTVVFYRDDAPIARISGSLEISYLKARVKDGRRGTLGQRGEIYPIAERDLMSVIRKRWASIDWEAAKRQAIQGYWQAYTPPALPEATEPRTATTDPSIIVARTIRAPDGQVIARKGQHINPLAIVPFTGAIVAFDGRAPKQVRLAGLLAKRAWADGLRAILLTQGLPGDKPGFDALERLEHTLGAKVYLLDAQMIQRFNIQALPATVRSRGSVFITREFNPDDTLARRAGTKPNATPATVAQIQEEAP